MKILIALFLFISLIYAKSDYDYLFMREAIRFNIPFKLLKAIAITESSLNEKAVNYKNKNGTNDYGLMQINSIHLIRFKDIKKEDLFNPSINIYIGAEILKKCVNRYGLNYKALNCYNGKVINNPYSNKVIANLLKINKGIDYDTITTANRFILTK